MIPGSARNTIRYSISSKVIFFTVADLIHDTHAYVYRFATSYLQEDFRIGTFSIETWTLQNLYFGYAVTFVSHLAVFATLFRELRDSFLDKNNCEKSRFTKARNLARDFGTVHGWLWSLSLVFLSIILMLGRNCQPLM